MSTSLDQKTGDTSMYASTVQLACSAKSVQSIQRLGIQAAETSSLTVTTRNSESDPWHCSGNTAVDRARVLKLEVRNLGQVTSWNFHFLPWKMSIHHYLLLWVFVNTEENRSKISEENRSKTDLKYLMKNALKCIVSFLVPSLPISMYDKYFGLTLKRFYNF